MRWAVAGLLPSCRPPPWSPALRPEAPLPPKKGYMTGLKYCLHDIIFPFKFLMLGYFWVVLMGKWSDTLSIAQANRYGKSVRKVTARLGIVVALGRGRAAKSRGFGLVLFGVESNYAMIACILVLVIYTALGGLQKRGWTHRVLAFKFGFFSTTFWGIPRTSNGNAPTGLAQCGI